MKHIFLLFLLIVLSCKNLKKERVFFSESNQELVAVKQDSLYRLKFVEDKSFVRIEAPDNELFSFENKEKNDTIKFEDFNADGKEDVMVYFGECGTGGCMFGVFLKQCDNLYKLAFFDYLKGTEFIKEKNGFWLFKSFEEVEPYNPSKLYVSIYKFNQDNSYYELDTTFISID